MAHTPAYKASTAYPVCSRPASGPRAAGSKSTCSLHDGRPKETDWVIALDHGCKESR